MKTELNKPSKPVTSEHSDAGVEAELEQLWRDDAKMSNILQNDLRPFRRSKGRRMQQSRRRAFVRALFTLIEADSSWRGRYVVAAWSGILSDNERRLLMGRRLSKSAQGQMIDVPYHRSPADRMFDAFDLFADTCGCATPVHRNSRGWHALQIALQVRNRVTHPGNAGELKITDRELAAIFVADQWFHEMAIELGYSCAAALYKSANLYHAKLRERQRTRQNRQRRTADVLQSLLEIDVESETA